MVNELDCFQFKALMQSASLRNIEVHFSSELEVVLSDKLQTQWNEVDNALCDTKFKHLETFKINGYSEGWSQSQAKATLKKLLPKSFKKKILWCNCRINEWTLKCK